MKTIEMTDTSRVAPRTDEEGRTDQDDVYPVVFHVLLRRDGMYPIAATVEEIGDRIAADDDRVLFWRTNVLA